MADAMGTNHALEQALERLESAEALDPVAERVASAVRGVLGDPTVRSVLSGTPISHPLHPALTDVPNGMFTAAAVLDALPGRWASRASATLIMVGLLAAIPTAATGLNDWSDTHGETQRVGLVHAGANGAALLVYAWSLLDRARGHGIRARLLGWLGLGLISVSGYLGGHLTYRRGIGVDENVFAELPDGWQPTLPLDDVPEGTLTHATVGEVGVAIFRGNGAIHAVADRCSHLGGPLHQGHVHTDGVPEVSCPWHHSTFRMDDGTVVRGPATAPQPSFDARVNNGVVEVRVRR